MKRTAVFTLLALGVLTSGTAMAQSHIGFRAIGANAAFVSPQDLDGTFGFGVFADMGRITPEIGLEPTIEYWSKTKEAFGAKASVRDVEVGARGKYYFDVANPKLRPFAGAGLGIHFLHSEASVTTPGFPTISASTDDTKLGLDLGGGMETPLNATNDFRAEAWYGIVSNVSQFALRVGVSHKLKV